MESKWQQKLREIQERNEGKTDRVTSVISESAFDELDAAKELLEELSAPAVKLKCLELAVSSLSSTVDTGFYVGDNTVKIAKQYYEWVTTTK